MNPGDYLNGLNGPAGAFAADPASDFTGTVLSFDETRCSDFAKSIAGDFNPLHNVGNSRFCVPGDLLFSALVSCYGLHAETSINFEGMLSSRASVTLPQPEEGRVSLLDERGREVLGWYTLGARINSAEFARNLVVEYVRYSGKAFPGYFVPLLKEANVMVNHARPIVIYKAMAIRLDADAVSAGLAEGAEVELVKGEHSLAIHDVKKGAVQLSFSIRLNGINVGDGEKHFVLGGLRPLEEDSIEDLLRLYDQLKQDWASSRAS